MSTSTESIDEYSVGGTMRDDDPTYVTRQADEDFYESLKAGKFCYVLSSRQMGKSSLRVRVIHKLKSEGIACAAVEIIRIISTSSDFTEEIWYAGLIRKLIVDFEIDSNFDLKIWWKERSLLSYLQRFSEFIETILLVRSNQNFVVFIDEIDSILTLKFSTDDFFAYIRSCWNERADKPEYRRLTFAILGVASASDLIQDKKRTPFNIGRAIKLNGFSFKEAQPLAAGLAPIAENPQAVLKEILVWTGGQPLLTQKVCQSIVQSVDSIIAEGSESEIVSDLIRIHIIQNWEIHDDPMHLKTICDRILNSNKASTIRLLGIYQQILLNGQINTDNTPEQRELQLTGLVVNSDNKLIIYNRIYAEVFDRDWLDKALKDLRPYAEAFNAWVASEYDDESRLLRGKALEDAVIWSEMRNLSREDYYFLNASQAAALDSEKQANQILAAAKQKAESSLNQAERQVGELLKQEQQVKQRLGKTDQKVKIASLILAATILASLGLGFWSKSSIDRIKLGDVRLASTESRAALLNNQGLEAILKAVRAGKKLQGLNSSVNDRRWAVQALQQANYWVLEQNRLYHKNPLTSASFSPDGSKIITASEDKIVRVWDVQGHLLSELTGYTSANFSPNGSKIVTVAGDNMARVWDVQGKLLTTLMGHTGALTNAIFSTDGNKIVTASLDKTARVWDVQGKLLTTLVGHKDFVISASFSRDGHKIVTASLDKTARVWDVQGKRLATLMVRTRAITSASFSPDSSKIVTASNDNKVRVWDVQGHLLFTLTGHTSAVTSASFSPDSHKIVTASADNTARVWDIQGKLPVTLMTHKSDVTSASFSPDGSKIVTASNDNKVRVWNVQGYLLVKLAGHTDFVTNASFSSDSSKIVTASGDKTARVWNLPIHLLTRLTGHKDFVTSASFSPDGGKIVTASNDKTARVWDIEGNLLLSLTGHTDFVTSASFSPDGGKIVTASNDKTARVWNSNGKFLSRLTGHTSAVTSASFSPDGSKIVTSAWDKTARVWDIEGNLLLSLTGHTDFVTSANFSPDGSKIVTSAWDKTARVWDIEGNLLLSPTGHTDFVTSANFSPDGSKIVTASRDKIARVWDRIDRFDSDLDRLIKRSCDKLHDYLSTNPNVTEQDREMCGITLSPSKK